MNTMQKCYYLNFSKERAFVAKSLPSVYCRFDTSHLEKPFVPNVLIQSLKSLNNNNLLNTKKVSFFETF
jgi:hypothetical protein